MIHITSQLVQMLIYEQFPQWKSLSVKPVLQSGHDNRTFHLGDKMTVRLPSSLAYVPQIKKEAMWLPVLAKGLSLPITRPVAQGKPTSYYPFPWSVNYYLDGENASWSSITDLNEFAVTLSAFLKMLQKIDTTGAPAAGAHNFYRGANPSVYQNEVEAALYELRNELDIQKIKAIWNNSISSRWEHPDVWIHGDIAPGNLLVKNGSLCGVIDFGIMGIGDPACDYAMAWTFFDDKSREYLLSGLDSGTIGRARGWALWKALITYHSPESKISENARFTLNAILEE